MHKVQSLYRIPSKVSIKTDYKQLHIKINSMCLLYVSITMANHSSSWSVTPSCVPTYQRSSNGAECALNDQCHGSFHEKIFVARLPRVQNQLDCSLSYRAGSCLLW